MDVLTKKQRSYCMSKIKSCNTKIELDFRKCIWKTGLRGYRIKSKITGRPDLYFPTQQIAVFIDGCFWHICPKCYYLPATNKKHWKNKINVNIKRDKEVNKILKNQGWKVLRFWGHELEKNINTCVNKIERELAKKTKVGKS